MRGYGFLLKIMSLSIVLCSAALFGMVNRNTKLMPYKKQHPVVDHNKIIQECAKAFQEADQEAEQINHSALQNAYINKDVLVHIGYGYSVKNELKNTCQFLHSKFSKTKQNMYQCALNKPYLGKNDINLAILNAARDKRTDVMMSILNNTQERQFYYDVLVRYPNKNGDRYVIFDLPEICEVNKMGSYYNIIDFPLELKDAEQKVFEYNLKKAKKRTFSFKTISLMVEAAFGSVKDVIAALSNRADKKKLGMNDLIMIFAIAIEHNNLDRLRALSLKAKEMTQNGFGVGNSLFYSLYDILLMTAMAGNKKEAFEMLAEIDPFNCLNFCASCRSTLNRIESWTYRIDNQNEYISLYRQHGGKYYCEIFKEALRKEKEQKQEKTEEKIKTPASVCVIS